MDKNQNYNKKLKPIAQRLRNEMTKSEACLWKYALKAKQMKGYSFNRQRPIGNYIVDFVCKELKIVIELDGISHLFDEVKVKDEIKEQYLKDLGYIVLRFTDEEVFKDMKNVIREIGGVIEDIMIQNPPPTPSKGG